ncbi:hypothetical protein [Asticcacaulis endophyticus]|uniref:Uncharacterized protein n=1 Tax=Asticcacaulis endophyticus TaxID=1395890 RepID=A0A918PUJ7_9CAUL|nr:hypothetical protein [Asticcacaulis endophyticus]GGZ23209.1 hypothetical protein GCM10011273_05190 [Asticcacaulis endophyticus]
MAEAAAKSKGGQYNTVASRRAQPHLDLAMTAPMPQLLDQAAELKPEYVLAYGLALELGREPATLSPTQRAKVQGVFQDFLNEFVYKKDNIALKGDEDALLGQPDFWIMMARVFGRKPQHMRLMGGTTLISDTTGAVSTLNFGAYDLNDNTFRPEDYRFSEETVLNRYMVYAAQSCAMYAKISEQMKKAQRVDAASVSHLTPEKLAEVKATARTIHTEALRYGPAACGGRDYFNKVSAFAAANLGRLNTLKDDPIAQITPVATDSPIP